jgi:predicted dithiol-disulfide oxidoreductase (DUF899 family)
MTQTLKPAKQMAETMRKPAIGASKDYLAARTRLLAEEIELRRHMERVAEQRRALPPGPAIKEDYVFEGQGADGKPKKIRLSELFREGTDSLVIYTYMFPRHKADPRGPAHSGETAKIPVKDQPCPSCTGLLDQLNAAALHFQAGGGNFAAVANTSLDNLLAVARDRGWNNLQLLSSSGSSFKRDYHAEVDGQQQPMTLVFKRDTDGTIRLFWASDMTWTDGDPGQDHRAAGTIEPFWTMFDLTPGGRPDFQEQLDYPCCGSVASGTPKNRVASLLQPAGQRARQGRLLRDLLAE